MPSGSKSLISERKVEENCVRNSVQDGCSKVPKDISLCGPCRCALHCSIPEDQKTRTDEEIKTRDQISQTDRSMSPRDRVVVASIHVCWGATGRYFIVT